MAIRILSRKSWEVRSKERPNFGLARRGRWYSVRARYRHRRMCQLIVMALLFILAAAPMDILCGSPRTTLLKPTGLMVTSFGSHYARLKWNINPSPGDTVIIMASLDGGTYRKLIASAADVSYCTVGLRPNRHYRLRIVAFRNSLQNNGRWKEVKSPPSNSVSVITDVSPATNFRAAAVGESDISLSWTTSPGAVGYIITRSPDCRSWMTLATIHRKINRFRDTSARGAGPYYYRIIAIGPSSNNSEQVALSGSGCVYPLDAAALNPHAAFTSGTEVAVEWTDPSNSTYPFDVQESSDSGTSWNTLAQLHRGVTTYAWRPVAPLQAGNRYELRIQILNGSGGSASSSVATIAVPGIKAGNLGYLVLDGLVVTLLLGALAIVVYWLMGKAKATSASLPPAPRQGDLELLDLGQTRKRLVPAIVLMICLIVAVVIFIFRYAIMGRISSDILHHIPARPSVITAVAVSPHQINLFWVDTADDESGFELQRRRGGDSDWYPIGHLPSGDRSFSDTTLQPEMMYSYRITAVNDNGLSGYIATSATTLAKK